MIYNCLQDEIKVVKTLITQLEERDRANDRAITPDFFIPHCQWIMPVTVTPQQTKDDLDEDQHSLYHSNLDRLVSIKPYPDFFLQIISNALNRMESDHDGNGRTRTVAKLEQQPLHSIDFEFDLAANFHAQHENPKPVLDVHSFHTTSPMHMITVTLTLTRRRILPHIH